MDVRYRCASLFFGRNEVAACAAVYHGWKFDEGNRLDMPNVPPAQDFATGQARPQGVDGLRPTYMAQ